jgi:hypothetical protein
VRIWNLADGAEVLVQVGSPVLSVALVPPRSLVAGT